MKDRSGDYSKSRNRTLFFYFYVFLLYWNSSRNQISYFLNKIIFYGEIINKSQAKICFGFNRLLVYPTFDLSVQEITRIYRA